MAQNQEFALAILSVRFDDAMTNRIRDLLQRNNAGTITSGERVILTEYLRVGQSLDLAQADARFALQATGPILD